MNGSYSVPSLLIDRFQMKPENSTGYLAGASAVQAAAVFLPAVVGAGAGRAAPAGAATAAAEGGGALRFAHGTSPAYVESVVAGLDGEAASAASKGGTGLAPGSFFAHEIGPPSAPGGGLQLAYEWGLRQSPTPAVVIGEIPGPVANGLIRSGGLQVLPVQGGPAGVPQLCSIRAPLPSRTRT